MLTMFKMGWARINLHFTLTEAEYNYFMFALRFLCDHAYKFLSIYTADLITGQWQHKTNGKIRMPTFNLTNFEK